MWGAATGGEGRGGEGRGGEGLRYLLRDSHAQRLGSEHTGNCIESAFSEGWAKPENERVGEL
jgi:hypothetical protein